MDRREFIVGSAAVVALASLPVTALGAPERNILVMPDPFWGEHALRIEHENSITIVYERMLRWDFATDQMSGAKVGSETYARWLAEDVPAGELPPHIGFGGAVVANPAGDPTFYERWKAFARTLS